MAFDQTRNVILLCQNVKRLGSKQTNKPSVSGASGCRRCLVRVEKPSNPIFSVVIMLSNHSFCSHDWEGGREFEDSMAMDYMIRMSTTGGAFLSGSILIGTWDYCDGIKVHGRYKESICKQFISH